MYAIRSYYEQHLQRRFDSAGLTLSVLKGPGLSQRLYGDMTLRHSKDLDLLVPPAQLWQACELLQAEGFTLLDAPPLSEANQRLVQRHYWHLTLRHTRITSYNVCYTKLLRSCGHRI